MAADPARPRRRADGQLAHEVLTVVSGAGRPVTVGEVRAALEHRPAYNTVQTVLVRLYEKGLVRRLSAERAHRYSPTGLAAELTAERMHHLLVEQPDRRSVLLRFVGTLDAADAATLRDLLRIADER